MIEFLTSLLNEYRVRAILREVSRDADRIRKHIEMRLEYAEASRRNDSQKCREINTRLPQFYKTYLDRRVRMYETIVRCDSDGTRSLLKRALKDQRWFVRQFAAEASTFLSQGKVDLTAANYEVVRERLTDLIASNKDYSLLAYRSTTYFQYYDLAVLHSEKELVSGYRPMNLDDTSAAKRSLVTAGADTVDDILRVYSEIADDYGRSDLIDVLIRIDDSRAKRVLLRDLFRNAIQSGKKSDVVAWCLKDAKKEVDSVFRSTISEEDKRQRLHEFLIALDAEGNGKTAIFCQCGYPIRVRYGDGSLGPIHQLCTSTSDGNFTNTYNCGNCGRFVDRITS